MFRWAFLAAAIVLLAGCAQSPAEAPLAAAPPPAWPALGDPHADPLANGPLSWTTQEYDFAEVEVGGPDAQHSGYEYGSDVRGTFTVPDGPGPFPLAVFLHGQHTTCSGPDGREGSDCDTPYRNDKGYLYLMEHLASHGIATASILAHEINNENGNPDIGMWARGELVLATIDAFAQSPHAQRLDLTRVGLMGHSRGGEGVVTAAEVDAGRGGLHGIDAIVALAPTDFAFRSVSGIPFLTLAPYCDGDVYSLHGLRQFDQSRHTDSSAVKVQLLVMGANHNNYNTQWGRGWTGPVTADGDDADFGRHLYPHCDLRREDGGGRLSLEETYAESILHLGGFLRWTLLGHDAMAPYFLGAEQPAAACPGATACPGAVHVSAMTPGRRDLFWAEDSGLVAAPGVTISPAPVCQRTACAGNVYSSAWMANLQMLEAGAGLRLAFDAPADLRDTPVLQVRVAVPTDGGINAFGPPGMTVTFTDTRGSHAMAVDDPALFLPPGHPVDPVVGPTAPLLAAGKVAANSVILRLPADLDAGNVTGIAFSFERAGPAGQALPDRVLVADAWFNRDTAAPLHPVGL